MNKKSATSQSGASSLVMLVMVLFFGGLLTLALKLGPAYLDNLTIQEIMEGLEKREDPSVMTKAQLREWLSRQLSVNSVRDFDPTNVVLERKGDGALVIVDYEVRTPLFFNVDALIHFRHEYEMRGQ